MKFRANTLMTLGASAAFGLAAVLLARSWINNSVEAEFQSAQSITEAVKVPLIKTITKPVVVANIDLNFGDSLSRHMLKVVDYPENAVPTNAYETINELLADNPRRVLLNYIAANEPMLPHKISGDGGRRALSELISPGMRAATFRVNTTSSVGGYILPNDRVDVLFVRYLQQDRAKINQDTIVTNVVFQNMKVLGVDLQSDQRSEEVAPRQSVTLEVNNEQAQKLLLMQNNGELILTLRAAGETDQQPEYTARLKDVFGKIVLEQPVRNSRPAAPKKPDDIRADVTVFRGNNRTELNVLNEVAPVQLGTNTSNNTQTKGLQ